MLNVKESDLWSVCTHLLTIYHKSAPSFDVGPWDRPPPTPHGHMTSLFDHTNAMSFNNAGLTKLCCLRCPFLSISMTACSSILALGMMPLCLLIYTPLWTSAGSIKIPYDSIGEFSAVLRLGDLMRTCSGPQFWPSGITLVALLVPITLGIYVKRRWPEKAKKILKVGSRWGLLNLFKSLGCRWTYPTSVCCAQVGSIAGFGLIIILAVVGGVLYQSSWVIAPSLWIIGTIYPFIGFGLGFILARVTGQPWYR